MRKPPLVLVLGTRPQIVKLGALSSELRRSFDLMVIDTGQHYTPQLSSDLYIEFGLPRPDHLLKVAPSPEAAVRLHEMIEGIKRSIGSSRAPIMCMGDTASTLAAALAARDLDLPLAHLEAGERSRDAAGRRMPVDLQPEELVRVKVDHMADLNLCATARGRLNLLEEGLEEAVVVGDVLYDLHLRSGLGEIPRDTPYHLVTCHRQVNTENRDRLTRICLALLLLDAPVVWPLHPRTRLALERFGLLPASEKHFRLIDPVSHVEMGNLIAGARSVLTDSGGVIREAYFHMVPSVILDDYTAWYELVETGWAVLAGTDLSEIQAAASRPAPARRVTTMAGMFGGEWVMWLTTVPITQFGEASIFGEGNAAERVAAALLDWMK